MRTIDLYSAMQAGLGQGLRGYEFFEKHSERQFLAPLAREWHLDQRAMEQWLQGPEAAAQKTVAEGYLQAMPAVVQKVEAAFGTTLPGVLVLMPSFGEFDGFARYDLGTHHVLLGIDFPDADVDYLKALTAHELSHVFRDHADAVWSHLGKPLAEVTRREYLEASTAQEHLVSEGLATLFSHVLFPEIHPHIHHYYEHAEWEWCVKNTDTIEDALDACLRGSEDVWSFYSSNRAGKGSPSRTQYYWAAKQLGLMLDSLAGADPASRLKAVVDMHRLPASQFPVFHRKE